MYPLNDKDLDRLSRDAAEQFDVEPSTSGWEHLETRLNKELPVKDEKDRRRFLFWIFFIALLSGAGLIGMLTQNKPATLTISSSKTGTATTERAATENATPKKAGNDVTDSKTKTITPANKATQQPEAAAVTTATNETTAVKEDNKTQKQSAIKRELAKLNKKENKLVGDPSPRPNRRQKPGTKNQLPTAPVVIANNSSKQKAQPGNNKPVGKETEEKTTEPETQSTTEVTTNSVTDPTNTVTEKNDKPAGAEKEAPAKKETTEPVVAKKEPAKKKTASPVKQPLEFGLVTGVDFNTVNFKQSHKAGLNIGLQVGYRFSNRLSVNTGLIYTKKYYSADGEDFTAPKHSYLSYVKMHNVTGNCSMLEIPLNVRYDIAIKNKNRFFVNAGLSSYLMNKEDYLYDYTYQNVRYKQPWKSDSTIRYMFSVLNVSAGYERAIGKQFSIQAEPYLKVPLKGLGYGSMKLDSYGVYFTLKYKPVWGKGNRK